MSILTKIVERYRIWCAPLIFKEYIFTIKFHAGILILIMIANISDYVMNNIKRWHSYVCGRCITIIIVDAVIWMTEVNVRFLSQSFPFSFLGMFHLFHILIHICLDCPCPHGDFCLCFCYFQGIFRSMTFCSFSLWVLHGLFKHLYLPVIEDVPQDESTKRLFSIRFERFWIR